MMVVKAFGPGLICRGYKYHVGLNVCDRAKCVRDGFHAAEDPLDCLDYYGSFEGNEFWLCEAGGDVDEDGVDSKISCTELTLIRRIDLLTYVVLALKYIRDHPKRPRNSRVADFSGVADRNHFVVVEGDSREWALSAKGVKVGDVLGYHDRADGRISVLVVDGRQVMPGVYYGADGAPMQDCLCRNCPKTSALHKKEWS